VQKNNVTNIYIHIPKTAGTTVKEIITKNYISTDIAWIYHPTPIKAKESFLLEKDKNYSIIMGHFDYGLHENLKNQYKYYTILRNPIDRVISHYAFVLNQKNHYLHNIVHKNKMSLNDFVSAKLTTELNNGQVRMLVGAGGYHKNKFSKYDIPYGQCDFWMLEEAKKNIKNNFSFIGIQEKFEQSLVIMSKKMVLNKNIPYIKVNQNRNKRKLLRGQVDKNTIETITKYNELDIELYNFVSYNFEKLWKSTNIYNRLDFFQLKLSSYINSISSFIGKE